MDTHTPTPTESAALKRIASLRSRVPGVLMVGAAIIFSSRLVEDQTVSIAIAACGVLLLLGMLLYISFGLRCPRCSRWIPAPSKNSKCVGCGLSLEGGSSGVLRNPSL